MSYSIFTITSDIDLQTVSGYNYFIVDASAGNIAITLMPILEGYSFTITRTDMSASTVTLTAAAGTTLDWVSSRTLTSGVLLVGMDTNYVCNWYALRTAVAETAQFKVPKKPQKKLLDKSTYF